MGNATISDVHFLAADLYLGLLMFTGFGGLGAALAASRAEARDTGIGLDATDAVPAVFDQGKIFTSVFFFGVAALLFVDAARVLFFGAATTSSAADISETTASTFFFLGVLVEAVAGLFVLRAFFVTAAVSSLDVTTFFVALGFAVVATCRTLLRNVLGAFPRAIAALTRHLEYLPICVFKPMADIFGGSWGQLAR